jgi:NADH dehydrogenase FAD-containing subunit
LHDLINEDLSKLYPDLIKNVNITVYDVAPKVLSMFDEKLGKYAEETFRRDGIQVKTSHHVESLRVGPPESSIRNETVADDQACWTLRVKEEGEIGVGMVVWSTGLMMNPFVEKAIGRVHTLPRNNVDYLNVDRRDAEEVDWMVMKDQKTGGLVTNHQLRLLLESEGETTDKPRAVIHVGRMIRLTD